MDQTIRTFVHMYIKREKEKKNTPNVNSENEYTRYVETLKACYIRTKYGDMFMLYI